MNKQRTKRNTKSSGVNTVPTLNKPILRPGTSGSTVQEMQILLRNYSRFINNPAIDPGATDGVFGDKTLQAVRVFQHQVFLPTTGIVADLTWRSLFHRAPVDLPTVKFGETSNYVQILENRLFLLGYLTGRAVDKVYDRTTLDALSRLQQRLGLPQRSTIDEALWFAISKIPVALPRECC